MAVINWFESLPSDSSEVRQTDDELRSLKTALRAGLSVEHAWVTSDGTQDAGAHLRGSARAFYDAQSNLSASNSTRGKLYVASDTSRLFYTPESGATQFVGSYAVPEIVAFMASGATSVQTNYPGANVRWVIETGRARTVDQGTSSTTFITFSTPYALTPIVLVTVDSSGFESTSLMAAVVRSSADSCHVATRRHDNVNTQADVRWISIGTKEF